MIAYKGWQAPGLSSGVTYNAVGTSPVLNDIGKVSYCVELTGPGVTSSTRDAIYAQAGTGIRLVARAGEPAPGAGSGATFTTPLGGMNFNNQGQTAFSASFGGLSPGSGRFSERTGSLNAVVRSGAQAPGLPEGYTFGASQYITLVNNNGAIGFMQAASNPSGASLSGVWSDRSGSLSPVATEGQAAPGTEAGVTFGRFPTSPTVSISDNWQMAFFTRLDGPGISGSNSHGIWVDRGNSLELLVRMGMFAPGTGSTFGSLSSPRIGGGGHVMFGAGLSGSGMTGNTIWVADPQNQLSLIAHPGMDAPGTPSGVKFGGFDGFGSYGSNVTCSINIHGQVAFYGYVSGPGITSANNEGIWATDTDGQLRLVVREGDQIEVAPGVFKTVADNSFTFHPFPSGGQDGLARWFNDRGEVAFRVWFTDNSQGLFVARVPEPASIALISAGILLFSRHGRRARSTSARRRAPA